MRARLLPPGQRQIAWCSEAGVRCRFVAKPPARENCQPGLRQESPARGPARWCGVACTFEAIAVNAAGIDSNGNGVGVRHRSFGSS